ncbi:hypothetical protein Ancab_002415 [Ancistrocladus abbreviatus]
MILQSETGINKQFVVPVPGEGSPFLEKMKNGPPCSQEVNWAERYRRRRGNTIKNSVFGVMSAATRGEANLTPDGPAFTNYPFMNSNPRRVTLKWPEKGDALKLTFLPDSLQEVLSIGARKFRCRPTKVLTLDGAEVEDIELIRDGDQLILVSDDKAIASEI